MMIDYAIKIFKDTVQTKFNFFLISLLLSLPAILLSEWSILAVPMFFFLLLSLIYGEKFLIALILITLFTLVGELNSTLRSFIHLIDFSLLGILFLRKYGLNFNSYPRIPKSLFYFLFLYGTAFLLSSVMSKYPFAGVGIFTKQMAFFIIAYIFYSFIKDEKDIKNYFISIIVVAFIFTTVFIITFINEGYDLLAIISKSRVRITALTGNVEAATNFFVISFPLIISFLMYMKKSISKTAAWLILFYSIIGLILAMSRSAILGIAVSTAIVFFILKRKRFYQFLFISISIVLIFIVVAPLNEIVTQLFRIEEGVSFRDYLWLMAVDIIKDNTLFGLGPGAYPYEMLNYYPFMLNEYLGKVFIFFTDVSVSVNLAHNIFLVFFSEMGILGLATIIALPIIYFRIGIKTILKYKNDSTGTYFLIVALFAAGASVIFRNFFNSIGLLYIGGIHTDLPFWLVFSSLIYYYRTPLNNDSNFRSDLADQT
ncbi:MAG: O-antigen ligase family protein [Ignavibacteriaceae bacterium]|nr:O-antigen ligase family protein [Ignavibacteriaceae bacterium]